MSHPCENTQRKIIVIDANPLIYSKIAYENGKERQIKSFWVSLKKEFCLVSELTAYKREFYNRENNEEFKAFIDDLIKKVKANPLLKLTKQERELINYLKKPSNNDEKGLAYHVKLAIQLRNEGLRVEIFTYDTDGWIEIPNKANIAVCNDIAHQLFNITNLPPNFPYHY